MVEKESPLSKETLKQEIVSVLKNGNIREINKIRPHLKYIEIDEIDNIVFNKNSNFST